MLDLLNAPGEIRTHGLRIRNPIGGILSPLANSFHLVRSEKSESVCPARLVQFGLGWTLHGHLPPALLVTKNELGAAISRLLPSSNIDSAIIASGLIILSRKKS